MLIDIVRKLWGCVVRDLVVLPESKILSESIDLTQNCLPVRKNYEFNKFENSSTIKELTLKKFNQGIKGLGPPIIVKL